MKSFSVLLLATLAIVFAQGIPTKNIQANDGHVQDELGIYAIDWTTDGTEMSFTVTAKTTGYVGIGISPTGSMAGADIFIGGVLPDGTSYAGDYFAFGHEPPTLDAQQDWDLVSASENATHTVFTVTRPVVANEAYPPDFTIPEGFAYVIWAFGETDDIEFHGFENIGTFNVTLL